MTNILRELWHILFPDYGEAILDRYLEVQKQIREIKGSSVIIKCHSLHIEDGTPDGILIEHGRLIHGEFPKSWK